jgi:hypothetical protein
LVLSLAERVLDYISTGQRLIFVHEDGARDAVDAGSLLKAMD